jgi:hypothetical protein
LIRTQIGEEVVDKLSQCISTLYQKEETSVVLSVTRPSYLRLGGSLEHTYVLTISTLPMQLEPTLNRRNAFSIQRSLANLIKVPSDRGFVRFIPVQEEMFATGGTTIFGKITAKTEFERPSPIVESSGRNHVPRPSFFSKLRQ